MASSMSLSINEVSASHSTIGSLECFPLEIMHLILGLLDLRCLRDIRDVNWSARTLVDNVPKYNSIVKHYPNVLYALLSTRIAVHFTTSDIFEALYTESCFVCGKFGPYLHLSTGQRCCKDCLETSLIMTAYSEEKVSLVAIKALPNSKFTSIAAEIRRTQHKCPSVYTNTKVSFLRLKDRKA